MWFETRALKLFVPVQGRGPLVLLDMRQVSRFPKLRDALIVSRHASSKRVDPPHVIFAESFCVALRSSLTVDFGIAQLFGSLQADHLAIPFR